ncbi:hypothetical protein PHYPO_G00048060 [Pangasianodon hypophthalmus]|uniref:PH domain-containing protein n=1 Tax=Pangasianodon hypophthalmus TaxID=310915 RepID=A0A5N5MGT1_PANHP|nr:hypothetical protein PHYPO_G00048060 [Pangasianodon hypophthalmus]
MDILVKEGSLFLQGVKFGKKIWRKIWVTVFKPSQAGIGRIEMYDMREGAGMSAKLAMLKKAEKRVIRLAECLSVTPALGESCPAGCTAFYLNTAQRIYTLAAPTQDEWVSALCSLAFQWNEGGGEARRAQGDGGGDDAPMTENDIYSTLSPGQFQVTVASSEASIRCCMFGSYLLSPEKESLCLLNMKTGHAAFCWPYRFLRRFGLVKAVVAKQERASSFSFPSRGHRSTGLSRRPSCIKACKTCCPKLPLCRKRIRSHRHRHRHRKQPVRHLQNLASLEETLHYLHFPAQNPPSEALNLNLPEALYAKVKPLPKPRNVPTPPALPVPKLMPEPETKPKDLDISDQEPDYESCDWNQKTQTKEDSSDSQLYSTVRPLLHTRRKPDVDTNQEQLKSSRQSPEFGHAEVPVSFKQILSDVLFKDVTRIAPPPPPKTYRENSNLSAEPDYYEIQK